MVLALNLPIPNLDDPFADGGYVGVGAYFEIHLNNTRAVVARSGGHVGHVGHAVDSSFERRHHGFGANFGVGTCIFSGYGNSGWGYIGVLGNGQLSQRQ